jgi:hypothetical protein
MRQTQAPREGDICLLFGPVGSHCYLALGKTFSGPVTPQGGCMLGLTFAQELGWRTWSGLFARFEP